MKNKKIYTKKVQPNKLENVLNRACWELFRNKLAHGIIFLNVIHFMLHRVARVKTTNMHVIIFVQHLKEDILAIDCNHVKNSIILRWRKAPQCKLILTKLQMIVEKLINIDHQVFVMIWHPHF
jgi:hypothetical protein